MSIVKKEGTGNKYDHGEEKSSYTMPGRLARIKAEARTRDDGFDIDDLLAGLNPKNVEGNLESIEDSDGNVRYVTKSLGVDKHSDPRFGESPLPTGRAKDPVGFAWEHGSGRNGGRDVRDNPNYKNWRRTIEQADGKGRKIRGPSVR